MESLESLKEQWKLILAAVVIGAAVIFALVAAPWKGTSVSTTGQSVAFAQMRDEPALWTANERDVSTLLNDMESHQIAAAGVTAAGILVSTQAGDHYYVADKAGRFTPVVLNAYGKDATFPLMSLEKSTFWNFQWSDLAALGIFAFMGVAIYRQFQGGFRLLGKKTDVTFADVIGAGEAKAAFNDVISYLKDPDSFAEIGARPPKGILLSGAPGTGKTRLAQAVAGECGVNFIATTGSDFTAMFYGVGVQRVKSLFRKARKNAPCVLFIDEIDGIGKRTSTAHGGAVEAEANRIINAILAEMDGFANNSGVIVIGATNFADHVDEALRREGRFDRKIQVRLPDLKDREALFDLYSKKIKAAPELDFAQMARLTTGLTPAAIAYIVNHSALVAARANKHSVEQEHMMEALEVCRIGEDTGGGDAMTPDERERIAVHEAGHAILAKVLNTGRLEKVTILPRGPALGITLVTPEQDKHLHRRSELENRIKMLLGGRCAELLLAHEASSGASSDLKEASKLALTMVATLGLGDTGRLLNYEAVGEMRLPFNSDRALDEANDLLERLHGETEALLLHYSAALKAVTRELLEHETIAGDVVIRAVEEVDAGVELQAA
ncbi:AAA family ATPase [Amantichitinum ursilacus]|uniref:ATP-dependent zinc metalloprotease FtsH n=1 Tax=Amantichitinum ursilacus TaxID=857265 RepID=A0A0N1JSQ3_9NEIS|nr:AAA family ATPase [Amantichitinum ursilacus]KPC52851.1 ATP-dependent zinc metalloprotease FtsH [Amantichitinum ursilacus]